MSPREIGRLVINRVISKRKGQVQLVGLSKMGVSKTYAAAYGKETRHREILQRCKCMEMMLFMPASPNPEYHSGAAARIQCRPEIPITAEATSSARRKMEKLQLLQAVAKPASHRQKEPINSTFFLLNAQGIVPKASSGSKWKVPYIAENILDYSKNSCLFMSITETWLKSYITDAQINVPNYNVYRCDRASRAR